MPGKPFRPARDEVLTTAPPPDEAILGMACFMPRKAHSTLSAIIIWRSPSGISKVLAIMDLPAQLTRTVRASSWLSVSASPSCQSSSSRTSRRNDRARRFGDRGTSGDRDPDIGIGLYEAPAFGAGHDHSRCLKFRVAEQRGGNEGHRFLDAVGLDRHRVAPLAADERANSFTMGSRLSRVPRAQGLRRSHQADFPR